MLPIKLKKKNTEGNCCSDGNEPEAKEPKVIYQRCAVYPSKRDR